MTKKGAKQGKPRGPRGVSGHDAEIGKRIRVRRVELKISQSELGERLKVSFQQIQKYEKGTNRVSAGRIVEIASALGVDTSYFYDQHGAKAQEIESIIFADPSNSIRLMRAYEKLPTIQRRRLVSLMEAMSGEADELEAE